MLHLKVHHIGYLVKKKTAREAFLTLGYTICQDWIRDEGRGIDICFLQSGSTCIELVCPYCDTSTVSGLMKRLKNSPYHICYISEDLDGDAKELREQGFLPIDLPTAAPACDGHPVQFFLHPSLGMIELLDHDFTFA